MRLSACFLLIAFLQVSASSMAQKVSLNQQNVPLEKVLHEIRRQSGLNIVYDLQLILNASPVSVKFDKVSPYEALQQSLIGQKLFFTLDGNTVVIKERSIIGDIKDALKENDEVVILVRDSAGRALPGANVYIKGLDKMFATNDKGELLIRNIPKTGYVILVSYLGTTTQELFINRETKKSIIVTLKSSTAVLDEVKVVSTGYQTLSRERAAGAYSVVSGAELAKTPTINIMERLEGRVPGVKFDIRKNTIQIRGVNNFSTNSGTPLIVVDGFPLMSPSDRAQLTTQVGTGSLNSVISNLNPADIDKITFLKDASATSIWGSRAANGVIVIDTKKGKRGAPTLNLSYNFGVSKNPSLSKLSWMSSAQYINLEQEMVDKGYIVDAAAAAPGNELYTSNNSEASEWMFRVKRGTATIAQRDAALADIASRDVQGQIEKNLLQPALNHQYNLSYSGGAENSTYFISGNYSKDVPIYKNNFGESAFVNAQTTADLFNKIITLRTGINYQFSRSQVNSAAVNALSTSTTALRPYDALFDAQGNSISRNIILTDAVVAPYLSQGYLPFSYNTMDELNLGNSINKNNVFRLNAGLNGKITKWLNADVSIAAQRQMGNLVAINEIGSYLSRILVNTGTVVTDGKLTYNVPYGGTLYKADQSAYDTGLRGQLNADFTIGGSHRFSAIAGAEIRQTGTQSSSETRYGYDSDTQTTQAVNPTVQYMTFYGYSTSLGNNLSSVLSDRKRYLSYFSNASYSYKDRYVLTGSVRFDDYTLQGIDRSKRAVPFWSAGLRWNAKKEPFMESATWLGDLALRATLGTSGAIPQGGSNVTVISISGTDFRTNQPIANIETPGNSDLGWETTRSANLGVDFTVFDGRLSGTFDFYNKRTKGILASFAFNPTYGWNRLEFNSGTLSGKGYEFGLNGKVISVGKFNWQAALNFSYNTNQVTDLRYANNASTIAGIPSVIEGNTLGSLYVYRWAGLDATGQSQIYDRNNKVISSNTNLTSTFTKDDLKYAGNTVAPYSGGFINSFSYGPFQASVQITAYLGHVFLKRSIDNYPNFEGTYYGVIGRQEDLAYRWRQPGDEARTDVPGLTGINTNSFQRYKNSDLLIRKADNIRLQQVSLSYNFPQSLLPSSVIKSLSVSANVRNLGIIWKANKDGIDPEYTNTGNYSSVSPTPSFIFGINASF